MKKIILTSLLAIASLTGMAQFKISGHIDHINKPDSIVLNTPFIYGHYRENNQTVPVDAKGNFSFTADVKTQKFATLDHQGVETSILMTPGKTLILTLDTGGVYKKFTGTAGLENDLLHRSELNKIAFFMQGDRSNNKYAKLNNADVDEQIVKLWLKTADDLIKKINASALPATTKALIASEVKYFAYSTLSDFDRAARNVDTKEINDHILSVFDGQKVDPAVFPAGPMYYYYANAYMKYLETKALSLYGMKDERTLTCFKELYKMSLDSATALVKQNGKPYINWVLFNANSNRAVAERYLAQAIFTQCHDKNIAYAETMTADLDRYFPKSSYRPYLQKKIDGLNSIFLENQNNQNIQVFKGYDKVKSIYDIIGTLKGKVVYMDIWGTWCGPCKEELNYLPQLKKHFKDKDVVYLYLDMDDDEKDATWKQFIRVNGMTGIHIRKNKTDVQAFWAELLKDKSKRGFYPTYFIFDKDGKLAEAQAKRPSDEAELYKQIEKYL